MRHRSADNANNARSVLPQKISKHTVSIDTASQAITSKSTQTYTNYLTTNLASSPLIIARGKTSFVMQLTSMHHKSTKLNIIFRKKCNGEELFYPTVTTYNMKVSSKAQVVQDGPFFKQSHSHVQQL